jgi:hypothetical protein
VQVLWPFSSCLERKEIEFQVPTNIDRVEFHHARTFCANLVNPIGRNPKWTSNFYKCRTISANKCHLCRRYTCRTNFSASMNALTLSVISRNTFSTKPPVQQSSDQFHFRP